MIQEIGTLDALIEVVGRREGYLYNACDSRTPGDCPIHHVTCPHVGRMLNVRTGTLSVGKLWSDTLEELILHVRRQGWVYALCDDPRDRLAPGNTGKPKAGAVPASAVRVTPALPSLRRPSGPGTGLDAAVLEAVAAVREAYRDGALAIRTEADLLGHLFAELIARVPGRPTPVHAHLSIATSREKIDLVVGESTVAIELKVEADYPGVSKPVVFPEDVWKDLQRLDRYVREGRVRSGYFLMLDQDGAHARRAETAGHWEPAGPGGRAQWLLLAFGG